MRIKCKFTFLILFIFQISISAQLPERYIYEINKYSPKTKKQVSPGLSQEVLISSTFIKPYLYVSTAPNSHIYRVNFESMEVDKDFGPAGIKLAYDSKYPWTITNDGKYIYGGTSHVSHLFYLDPDDGEINAFGLNEMQLHKVNGLFDATVYSKQKGGKRIVFLGTSNFTDSAKIVKWVAFDSEVENDVFEKIEILKPGLLGSVYDIEIGKNSAGHNSLYAGVTYSRGDVIAILDLEVESAGWELLNLNSIKSGLKCQNFIVQDQMIYFFQNNFDGSGKIIRYDILTKSTDELSVANWNNSSNNKYLYSKYGEYIYTHCGIINTTNFRYYGYKNEKAEPTIIDSRNIVINENASKIYGTYSWSAGYKHLYICNTGNLKVSQSVVNFSVDFEHINPVGGHLVTGLAASNNSFYAALDWSGTEISSSVNDPNWEVKEIRGAQADKIYISGDYRFYAHYPKPWLEIVYQQNSKLFPLDALINDAEQTRITDMVMVEDKYLFLSTSSSVPSASSPSRARILKINVPSTFSKNTLSGEVIGILNTASVKSLIKDIEVYKMNNAYRIFGCNGRDAFVFDHSLGSEAASIAAVSDNIHNTDCMLLYDNNILLAGDCHNLWIYDPNKLDRSTQFYDKNQFTLKDKFMREYCCMSNIPGCCQESYEFCDNLANNQAMEQLIRGNDNLVYGFHDGTIFYFNPKNIGTYPRYIKKEIVIPDYTKPKFANQGYEITNLAKDENDLNNKTIFVGTRVGRIYKIVTSKE